MRPTLWLLLLCLAGPCGPALAADSLALRDYRFDEGAVRSVTRLATTGDAFLVEVTIGERGPFPFALDTGSGDAIDAALARTLGLVPTGSVAAEGAGERSVRLGIVRIPAVTVGSVTLFGQRFRVLPPPPPDLDYAPPYRGLLGRELFERLVVRIDQDEGEVVLSEPAGWRYRGDGVPVRFRLEGGTPVVEGTIDGTPGRFSLDTGQANTLTLFRPFLVAAGLQHRWAPKLAAPVGWGIGGDIMAEVARGRLLTLGGATVTAPVLYLSLQRSGAFGNPALAGNVGQGAFARFDTVFDYPRRTAWFERSRHYGTGDTLHVMTLKRSFGGFTVLSVLPGGPAAAAGIRAGDEIEEIEGRDATRVESYDLYWLFRRRPGTRIELEIRSNGHLRTVVLVLAPAV